MKNRYVINKLGLINFWYYDIEEFDDFGINIRTPLMQKQELLKKNYKENITENEIEKMKDKNEKEYRYRSWRLLFRIYRLFKECARHTLFYQQRAV